jgi:hypothetical protein
MVAAAALLIGGIVGFLFGIPKALQQEGTRAGVSYQGNTSLEQISDWLTKILVGVGLTQITALPGALQRYADYASIGLGSFPSSGIFSLALLIYFLVCGFLISYLWTRVYLPRELVQSDLAAQLTQVASELTGIQEQADIDAKALSVVQNQLDLAPGAPDLPQEEINKAIEPATAIVKAQIFDRAQRARRENWKERRNKPAMERTIPIFMALVDSDKEHIYHRNYGQLGYALKDQRQPDWAGAAAALTRAIEIRGPWQQSGWPFYEFNRAICRMNLDEAFKDEAYKQGRPSDENTRQAILDDLRAAATELDDIMRDDATIKDWLELNSVSLSEITQSSR